ncbi:MAG: class I SAM-dependent methyltransferase [Microcoleaceae cyanobacterium]
MTSEQSIEQLRQKVKNLATEAVEKSNPTGWFETLYQDANGAVSQVPWAQSTAHTYIQNWLENNSLDATGKTAIVVGCGLGDDAESLAKLGFQVTAFDISPTAVEWCKNRFPNSTVNYQVADLFNLNPDWKKAYDFVLESRTIQALPLNMRMQTIKAIADLLAENGTLLMVTRYRETEAAPDGPPWALSEGELNQFQQLGLTEIKRDSFFEADKNITQLRLEYHKK